MKLAFSSLGCPEIAVEKLPEVASRHRYGGVELRGTQGEHVHPSMSADERRSVRESFRDAGVEIIAVTAYTRFAQDSADALAAQVSELVEYAKLASDLGASFVRTFMGGGKTDGEARDYYDSAAGALLEAAERCATYGVTVLMESHDTVSSTSEVMSLLDRARHPSLGVLWDAAHSLMRTDETAAEGWNRVRERVGYLHLKDEHPMQGDKKTLCLPGEGIVPLAEIRALTETSGFSGWYCLEWERKWHPYLPPIEEALEVFRRVMGATE